MPSLHGLLISKHCALNGSLSSLWLVIGGAPERCALYLHLNGALGWEPKHNDVLISEPMPNIGQVASGQQILNLATIIGYSILFFFQA